MSILPNPLAIKQNGIIGYMHLETELWTGTDAEQSFKDNLAKNPSHPDLLHYKDSPIEYKRNMWGHRSVDVAKITATAKPYILVTGDSFTEGVGLHQHETYGELLSKKTGLPVYNLGLAGTGIDIMLHNLMMWKNHVRPAPKILVVQWSYLSRTCQLHPGNALLGAVHPATGDQNINKFLDGGLESGLFETRAILADRLIQEFYKSSEIVNVHIPSWESEVYGQQKRIIWNPERDYTPDFARDLQHTGRASHEGLANRILKLF